MRKAKPRGPTPSLIGGTNGKPKRVRAGKLCECSRCHVTLVKGQECIDIPKLGTGFSASRRVCAECFGDILEKTQSDLDALRQAPA